jgi:hypothetical protein
MNKYILYLILLLEFNYCASPKTEKLYLSQNLELLTDSYAIVFYHDGDCSYCYSVLDDMGKSFPKALIVSVTKLKDTSLINFQLERFAFKGCSIIDSSGTFYLNNSELLIKDRLFLVNVNREILLKGLEYNQDTKKHLKNILNE